MIGVKNELFFSGFFNFFLFAKPLCLRNTLKYVVPMIKRFFSLLFFFTGTSFLSIQFLGSNFSYLINKVVSYIVYYYLAFLIYASILFIFAGIITMAFRYKININLYKVSLILVPIILLAGTFFKHHTIIKKYDIKLDKNYNFEPLILF